MTDNCSIASALTSELINDKLLADCTHCHTMGYCQKCDGNGFYIAYAKQKTCEECNALGICYYCDGTGKVKEILTS